MNESCRDDGFMGAGSFAWCRSWRFYFVSDIDFRFDKMRSCDCVGLKHGEVEKVKRQGWHHPLFGQLLGPESLIIRVRIQARYWLMYNSLIVFMATIFTGHESASQTCLRREKCHD